MVVDSICYVHNKNMESSVFFLLSLQFCSVRKWYWVGLWKGQRRLEVVVVDELQWLFCSLSLSLVLKGNYF